MKLKEEIHRTIDTLDNHSLTLLYEQVRVLQKAHAGNRPASTALDLDEVLKLTSRSLDAWSDDVIAAREERQ